MTTARQPSAKPAAKAAAPASKATKSSTSSHAAPAKIATGTHAAPKAVASKTATGTHAAPKAAATKTATGTHAAPKAAAPAKAATGTHAAPKAAVPAKPAAPAPKAPAKAAAPAPAKTVAPAKPAAPVKQTATAAHPHHPNHHAHQSQRQHASNGEGGSRHDAGALHAILGGKSDTMKAYMREIGQIPLVTRDEEVDLAALIARGDPDARAKLIQSNLRLVVKIAHDFKGLGLPLLDLISEGNIGLMKAVEKFDPSKGAKFSSYAAWWIKQSMRRALSNQSRTIRIPVQSAGKINKIKTARMKLTEQLGREPTDVEIANHLEFSERTVTSLRLAELRTFSLQDPIQQGEESMFQDIIPDYGTATPDETISDMEMLKQLKGLISRLDERERLILMMRFGLDGSRPKTLEEVSKIIGRTRERVRQIQNQALTKLRKFIEEDQAHQEIHADATARAAT